MWLYVAPGSGVSMNVGRTLDMPSYGKAADLLARAFPGNHTESECLNRPASAGVRTSLPTPATTRVGAVRTGALIHHSSMTAIIEQDSAVRGRIKVPRGVAAMHEIWTRPGAPF